MLDHDPNGESYEAYVERMAGASPSEWLKPRDWPQPKPPPYPADDEDDDA